PARPPGAVVRHRGGRDPVARGHGDQSPRVLVVGRALRHRAPRRLLPPVHPHDPRIRRRTRPDRPRPQGGDGTPPDTHQSPDRHAGGRAESEPHMTSTDLVIKPTGEVANADSINAYLT